MTFYIICLENLRGSSPPCPDRAETRYRRVRSRAGRGSGRSWSGTATPRRARRQSSMVAGYVLAGVTRVFSGLFSGGDRSAREQRCEPNDDETNSGVESICQTISRRDSQQRMAPRIPSQRMTFLPDFAGLGRIAACGSRPGRQHNMARSLPPRLPAHARVFAATGRRGSRACVR